MWMKSGIKHTSRVGYAPVHRRHPAGDLASPFLLVSMSVLYVLLSTIESRKIIIITLIFYRK